MTCFSRRGMYWSIVAVDASGTKLGSELARAEADVVKRAWERMKATPPKVDGAHELVLRDTGNRVRERHALPRQAA